MPISLNYPDGRTEYTTSCGALLSILITTMTALLLANNLVAMFTYSGSIFSSSVMDSNYSYNDTFTQNDGLRFAFMIPNYDSHLKDKIALELYMIDQDSTRPNDKE